MKLIKTIALVLMFIPSLALAEVAVIVSADSTITRIDAKDLERVYLGKSKTLGDVEVTPVNLENTHDVAAAFNRALLNKSSSQVKAYWSKLIFTGKGTPPKEVSSEADMLSTVAGDSTAVGYVDSGSVTDDVKVLLTL